MIEQNNNKIRKSITFLYTNIGRGHPFYLDGIIEALIRKSNIKLVRHQTDVFQISKGISLLGWKTVRWLYKKGSNGGMVSVVYKYLRTNSDYNQSNIMLKILGKCIRKKHLTDTSPLLTAHPVLAAILKNKKNLFYQHGEVVTPPEAVVLGASHIFVPTDESAQLFYDIGYKKSDIIITGLCIEPALVKQAVDAMTSRTLRFNTRKSLTGAFFSSGAEPKEHVEKLVMTAKKAVTNGGSAIIFAQHGKHFMKRTQSVFQQSEIKYQIIDSANYIPMELPAALIISFRSRREENIFTARLFNNFDYFVSPSHERTNWALGLGLPMFIVRPAIGPFSPLNEKKLLDAGVARIIKDTDDTDSFAKNLSLLHRQGQLTKMSEAGWEKHQINGFEVIADFFINKFG